MPMLIAKKHTKIITIIASSVVILGLAIFGWLHFQQTTKAADMRQFNAGNIMSDAVMSNKNSMSVQQIQAFLTSKNPCNDTATYKAAWYPNLRYNIRDGKFVCISNETFNGESAAQIIWQTGQDYNINPQVLIVLLEKEQGLISDTWPNHQQYRTAVGFGCPDTAPCDAQYYGLKNQLRQAASLFRNVLNGGWSNYPVGQTYVQYNPNAACGGSVVNIQNRATSALYRYTPYQPNQSALNAGYGTGDGCGAYGNRNFWGLFTDWFGDTQGDRWQSLLQPRVMITNKDTVKINPDTKEPIQAVAAGLEIKFATKTDLNDMTGCLRTQFDTDRNVNACIKHSDTSDFNPTLVSLKQDGAYIIGKTIQWTCKVQYKTTTQSSQCFGANTYISFAQKVTVAGIEYLITVNDSEKMSPQAFRADRITLLPDDLLLSNSEQKQENTTWTCKVNLDTMQVLSNQCFNSGTRINFARKTVVNSIDYLITTHDSNANNNYGFIAQRFTHKL